MFLQFRRDTRSAGSGVREAQWGDRKGGCEFGGRKNR
jgi:hypothetical protein